MSAKSFLKWAGGKSKLADDILQKIKFDQYDDFIYIEPFVGGGAILFKILNNFPNLKSAVICDSNFDLINVYKTVKNKVSSLVAILKQFEKEYCQVLDDDAEKKKYYYNKRLLFNTRKEPELVQAALFIFLNKTCFNGLYRVNKNNQFNVPVGSYTKPLICDEINLKLASKALQKVRIMVGDFEQTNIYAGDKTLYYFDPPYKPLSKSSGFTAYIPGRFDDEQQKRLKLFCDEVGGYGSKWILSNSNCSFFEDLYCNYEINKIMAGRNINSNGDKRKKIVELIINN